jgi:hypothetical protein
MNTTTGAALARLRSVDPVSGLPVPDAQDVTARAMLDQILAEPPGGTPGHRRTRRRLVMAGVVATTAAAVVAAGVVTTPWSHGRPASAAYAVTTDGDGAVSVTVYWDQLRDPAALNAELARLGARTVVMQRSTDGACRTGVATDPAHPPYLGIKFDEHPELRDPAKFRDYVWSQMPWIDQTYRWTDGVAFTIRPNRIPTGDTLLIPYEFARTEPAEPGGTDAALYGSMLVRDVPACFPGTADAVYTTNGVEVR